MTLLLKPPGASCCVAWRPAMNHPQPMLTCTAVVSSTQSQYPAQKAGSRLIDQLAPQVVVLEGQTPGNCNAQN